LEVEAPGGQDAEAQEYQAYSELPQRSPTGWIDIQNVKLFLSEPLVPPSTTIASPERNSKAGGNQMIEKMP
jgi:hypothetical protein